MWRRLAQKIGNFQARVLLTIIYTDHSTDNTFNRRFVDLFGEPRLLKMRFYTEATGFPRHFGEAPTNYTEECRLKRNGRDRGVLLNESRDRPV